MKKEDIMRRVSGAIDSADGLAGDPALQEQLRADPEIAKYAKDVTRLGKWLATWPLPEPDDAAFEALAKRIEQRFDDSLPTMSDPAAAPVFDDDDALRDATASLLSSGEFPLSDSSIELVSDPSSPGLAAAPESKPASPIAKVTLSKARVPAIVEESSGSGEPLSSAELEPRLDGKPKKKKKKKTDGSKSSDRVSIPTPKPSLGAPSLAPVVQLPRAEERKGPGAFWWFAAAATVGLGVFGAASLFDTQASPDETVRGSTLVTTGAIAPTAPASAPVAVSPVTVPMVPPIEAAEPEAADMAAADTLARPPATAAFYPPATMAGARMRATGGTPSASPAPPPPAPARMAHGGGAGGGAGAGDLDDALGAGLSAGPTTTHHAATGTTARTEDPTPTHEDPAATRTATSTPTTTSAPDEEGRQAPAHLATPAPTDPSLPSTPDRSTIQAVLAARTEAVTACAAGAHGVADVDIVIASSGRITTATVNGPFAGTPVGSCIARTVRGATFPPFSQPRFEVTYPFHL